jgi:predicted nucleic acid-binding protein
MKKLRVYLDNCCFNRPYDDQTFVSIKIETEAKIALQNKIRDNEMELCWSYILDIENSNNPFPERKKEIEKWKQIALYDVEENDSILLNMNRFIFSGIKPLDALHISCAIEMECDYFFTVDKGILKKGDALKNIIILSPIDFILNLEKFDDDRY